MEESGSVTERLISFSRLVSRGRWGPRACEGADFLNGSPLSEATINDDDLVRENLTRDRMLKLISKPTEKRWQMDRTNKVAAVAQDGQFKVLCIDNHASSNFACFLLRRGGYHVTCAGFLSDAFHLIQSSKFDLYLVNDEFARAATVDLFEKFIARVGSTPLVFYSTVIYPFSPRSADQSGRTTETPVPLTEVVRAVDRVIGRVAAGATRSAA